MCGQTFVDSYTRVDKGCSRVANKIKLLLMVRHDVTDEQSRQQVRATQSNLLRNVLVKVAGGAYVNRRHLGRSVGCCCCCVEWICVMQPALDSVADCRSVHHIQFVDDDHQRDFFDCWRHCHTHQSRDVSISPVVVPVGVGDECSSSYNSTAVAALPEM